jgi:transmembrane sensor
MKHSEAAKLVREKVEPPWDELRAARVQKRVLESLRNEQPAGLPRAWHLPRAAWVVGALSAVAAVVLFFVLRTASVNDARITASRIDLADGSVALLDEGARVVPETVVDNRVELRQLQGAATYDVVPGRSRKFSVLVEDVRIDVLGTSFRVDKFEDGLHVSVLRGKVQVTRGDRSVVLAAGEEITWREEPPATEPVPNQPSDAGRVPAAGSADAVPVEAPAPSTVEPPKSNSAQPSQAPAQPSSAAPTPEPAPESSAAELFRQADDARAAGNLAEGIRLLQELIAKHPKDSRVTLATFTIGRLELQRGNAEKAAVAFESCGQALGGEALAEAALARSRAGQSGAASTLAARYLQLFPEGARAKEMTRLAP